MCTICASYRPYDPSCVYESLPASLPVPFAAIAEDPSAPEDTSTTNTMSVGDVFSGNLETVGDDDWVAVDLTAGTEYEFRLDGSASGGGTLSDPYLRLYDSTGAEIAQDDDGGLGRDSRLVYTPTSDGTYYVSARAWNDGSTGSYEISVDEYSSSLEDGTLDQLAAYLTDGYWADNGGSRHAFDTSTSNVITVDITALDDRGQFLARAAMEAWEAVADIQFDEVSDDADVTFSDNEDGAFSTYSAIGGSTTSSTVNVSTDWLDTYGSGYDSYSFSTYIHEIGHALGLGHSGPYNVSATYPDDAVYSNDSYQLTVMSYFSQIDNTDVDASYALQLTTMAADIVAIQDLYGAPDASSATAGDTVYGVGQTIGGYMGEIFDIMTTGLDPDNHLGNGPVALTLYDHSGTDTVDLSDDTSDQTVNLNSLGIWDVYGLIGNVVIARGTVIENYVAGEGDDYVLGNATVNRVEGNDGNDTLIGADGDDTLVGGLGADTLNGGDGVDLADYSGAAAAVTADMLYTIANTGEAAGDFMIDVENLEGSNFGDNLRGTHDANVIDGGDGNDIVYARGGDDSVVGGAGDDLLVGQDGDDVLVGGDGADTLNGGNGVDTADYSGAAAAVTADMLYARAATSGAAAGDLMIGIETLTGSGFRDQLRGTHGGDVIDGGDGDDLVYARGGDDTVMGGAGSDTLVGMDGDDVLVGGDGADTLNGGDGVDLADYSGAAAGLTVDIAYTRASTGEAAGDFMIDMENLTGSAFDDNLRGTHDANVIDGGGGGDIVYARGGDDTVMGGAGSDTLVAQDGDDVLVGGDGADTLNGGNGVDLADYSGATAGLTVDIAYTRVSTGEAAGDFMIEMENLTGSAFDDDLRGTDGANVIDGGNGGDLIRGRAGDDTLIGGAGDDMLRGDAGADTFVFATGAGADVVMDFEDDVDILQFDASLVAGGTAQDFVDTYADDSTGTVVIDIGNGNTVTLWGITDTQDIVDDLVFV